MRRRASGAIALAGLAGLAGCSFEPVGGSPGPDPDPTADAPATRDAAVDPDAAPDAPIDAPSIACPSGYRQVSDLTSRYRLIPRATFESAHDTCKGHLDGHTHLVVLDSLDEGLKLRNEFNEDWWTGSVQQRNQASPSQGWRKITGGDLSLLLFVPTQPDDGPTPGENNEQNFGVRRLLGLEDTAGTDTHPGLCECDHRPVDKNVEDDIDDDDDDDDDD